MTGDLLAEFTTKDAILFRFPSVLCVVCFLALACAVSIDSTAQTPSSPSPSSPSLSQQLLREGVSVLARDARRKGDAVNGAIVFSQQKFNCVGCHAQGAANLLGPDLTRMDDDVTDEYLVESVLMPSKLIKKGFESHQFVMTDGSVVVGRIIDDSDKQRIRLRDASKPDVLITLSKEEIEQSKPLDISSMPKGLADQLADRQQFLDLVKYLMDIAATSSQNAVMKTRGAGVAGRQVDQWTRGLVLIDRFGCVQCHEDIRPDALARTAKKAPDLASVGTRLRPEYIKQFVASPLSVKPGTSMPSLLGHLDDETKTRVASAIAVYLGSLSERPFHATAVNEEAAARGNELFHSVGCVACHSPRDSGGKETLADDSVPLGDLSGKYSLESLSGFLKDPHSVRPSGRMPNLKLTHWESTEIASYLLRPNGEYSTGLAVRPDWLDSDVALGKKYFREFRCVKCHQMDGEEEASSPRIMVTRLDRGCLSDQQGDWPKFSLDLEQKDAIRFALERLDEPLDEGRQITVAMETFRCSSCHERDGLGGVSDERNDYFQTTNENLGPQGRIPPTLTGVGSKLKPKWMRQVLVSGRAIRPYVITRMPQYGAENVGHLVPLFSSVDPSPEVEFGEVIDEKETKKVATELVGNRGLNCIACHTFQQKPAQTMPAVDLTEMAERLQKNWFYRYMRAPQLLNPGTVMPSFWPGGKAIRGEMLDGDSDRQIEALWRYLEDGRQARTPPGLKIEPIELLAETDRAVMLRRSYPDIGKRGIGVGYPGEVNLAFDAEQMRIGLIWRGKFADPGGVWRSQGHGRVRPLSREVLSFPPGPELDDETSPWVVDEGRPPKHQFKGYFLDDQDRPTFLYRFEDIEVEDYVIDTKNETGKTVLQRTLTLNSKNDRPNLVFRIASGESIRQDAGGWFRVGRSLRVQSVGDNPVTVVDAADRKNLVVRLNLSAGQTKLVLRYDW